MSSSSWSTTLMWLLAGRELLPAPWMTPLPSVHAQGAVSEQDKQPGTAVQKPALHCLVHIDVRCIYGANNQHRFHCYLTMRCIFSPRTIRDLTKSHLIILSLCRHFSCTDSWAALAVFSTALGSAGALWTIVRKDTSYSHSVFPMEVFSNEKSKCTRTKGSGQK